MLEIALNDLIEVTLVLKVQRSWDVRIASGELARVGQRVLLPIEESAGDEAPNPEDDEYIEQGSEESGEEEILQV